MDPTVYTNAFLVLFIAALVIFAIAMLAGTIFLIVRAKKSGMPMKKWFVFFTILMICLVAVSWIFNMGWFRFFMTFLLVPVLHAVPFYFFNLFVSSYVAHSRKIKVLAVLYSITYFLPYAFFPDGGDYGPTYFFFGLIRNSSLFNIAMIFAGVFLLAHLVLFVLLIIELAKFKRPRAEETAPDMQLSGGDGMQIDM